MAGHLALPGSVFAFLAGHRHEPFPDGFTADLFPNRARRSTRACSGVSAQVRDVRSVLATAPKRA